LSREIPEKWRPYLKKGVEDWRPAFEEAGLKKAIVCRDAPERSEDPNWDPEAAPTPRPLGPFGSDPKTHSSELRAVARQALKDLSKRTKATLPEVKDPATRMHLEDSFSEIESALAAKKS
jgi:hypothetical protein